MESDDAVTNGSVSIHVIEAVSTADGIPPEQLDPPLFDVIDPESLDRLVRSCSSLGEIRFGYRDWTVVIRDGDEVNLEHRNGNG